MLHAFASKLPNQKLFGVVPTPGGARIDVIIEGIT